MKYQIVRKEDYKNKKNIYLNMFNELFKDDNSKIANIEEFLLHLDFIFSNETANDALLILNIKNEKIISMINFLQYNNIDNYWCLFSLFTLKNYRRKGHGEDILKYGIKEIEKLGAEILISGIEKENLESIKLHEKVGFKYSGKSWDELAPGFPKNHLGYILDFMKDK